MWTAPPSFTLRFHHAEGILFYTDANESMLERWAPLFSMAQQLGIRTPLDSFFNAPPAPDIIGGEADDRLTGDWRDDFIWGKDGDDRMYGGRGSDILVGGAGADTFIGGAGNDKFVVDGDGDVIYDFRPGDVIRIINDNRDDEISFVDGKVIVDGEVKVELIGVETLDLSQVGFSVPNYSPA